MTTNPGTEKRSGSDFPLHRQYGKLRSSIYGRVVILILITSVFLFVSFSIIFRQVNEEYLNKVIMRCGNNIASIIHGSLYYSMLENDKHTLQNTLDVINRMTGLDEVHMYNGEEELVYTSVQEVDIGRDTIFNCNRCHQGHREIFGNQSQQFRILDEDSQCAMKHGNLDERHLLISLPIPNEPSCYNSDCHAHPATEKVLGSLIIKMPLKELDAAVQKSSTEFYLLAVLTSLILSGTLIVFTRRRIKSPLNDLVKASLAVGAGDLNTRINVTSNHLDDMKVVANAFNNMLDSLQNATNELENWSQQLEYKVQKKSEELSAAQNELIHIERLASLGKLSSSVAHEINNPLSGILVYSKLIHKQLSNPELKHEKRDSILKHLKLIESEAKRCGDIVKGLLEFSKRDQEDFEPRNLHDILRETQELMAHPIKMANVNFYTDFAAGNDLVYCSPNQIKQACLAMLVNATEAVQANGEITIRTSNPDEDTIRFDIYDTGVGITPENLQHIFEPFFSTKQNASGIGLGLAIVHGIIQSHKGRIQVFSEPGKGTTFAVSLPLITSQTAGS